MSQENLDSEEKIAALVYGTQKTMADKGVNESLSSLIAHLDQGFPANAPKQHWHEKQRFCFAWKAAVYNVKLAPVGVHSR